jgi:hypothetical protein
LQQGVEGPPATDGKRVGRCRRVDALLREHVKPGDRGTRPF